MTKLRILFVISILALITTIIGFWYMSNIETCASLHSPSIDDLMNNGFNRVVYTFRNKVFRAMCEHIYDYRVLKDYKYPSEPAHLICKNIKYPHHPPKHSELSDVALFMLATVGINEDVDMAQAFTVRMSYVQVINHPLYLDCIRAYFNGAFGSIHPQKSTRNIIIHEILGVDTTLSEDEHIKQAQIQMSALTDEQLYKILTIGFKSLIQKEEPKKEEPPAKEEPKKEESKKAGEESKKAEEDKSTN